MKKNLILTAVAVLTLCLSACGPKQHAEPMFWTWLDYRAGMNFDSVCTVMNQSGIDGVMLNAPTPDDYRVAIPVAKAHGIKVFAWLWTMNLEHDRAKVLSEHPEWLSVNRLGRSLADTTAYVDYYKFLCPALPEVREYLNDKIKAYCEVDGLDGIALDYHRFVDVVLPTTLWPNYGVVQDREYPEWDFGYHPAMIEKFKAQYGYDPREQEDPTMDVKWRQFRCDQIAEVANLFAETIHSYGKQMGASPFPTPKMASRMVRQDWSKWDLDIVFPMVYTDFYTLDPSFAYDCTVENVRDKNPKTELYCGLGVNFGGRPQDEVMDELIKNMDLAFAGGAQGIAIFTVNNLRTPEMQARFKAYADSLRALRDANGGRLPAVSVPDHADPDPFAHEGLMKLVEAKIASLAGAPVQLGEYKVVNEFNVTKDYEVADAVSGAKFLVSFWSYGDIVSGWDVKKL